MVSPQIYLRFSPKEIVFLRPLLKNPQNGRDFLRQIGGSVWNVQFELYPAVK
jgi:hypothetical protein